MSTIRNTLRVNEHPLPKSEVPCRFQENCNHQARFNKPCPFKHNTEPVQAPKQQVQAPKPQVPCYFQENCKYQEMHNKPCPFKHNTQPQQVYVVREEVPEEEDNSDKSNIGDVLDLDEYLDEEIANAFGPEAMTEMRKYFGPEVDEFDEFDDCDEFDELDEFDDFVQDPDAYNEEWIEAVNDALAIILSA